MPAFYRKHKPWMADTVRCPRCFKRISKIEVRTFFDFTSALLTYVRCPKCGIISIIKTAYDRAHNTYIVTLC